MSLPYILTKEKKQPAEDRLRELVAGDRALIVPERHDCMSAKAAEMNGFSGRTKKTRKASG